MIDRSHEELPVKRQAELPGIGGSMVYDHPEPIPQADLRLMRRSDELHLEHPFAGSRRRRDLLRREGFEVGRRPVARLMRRMGIEALYRKPNTRGKHPVYPYLLRGLAIERANPVWAMDITYIPMARGFVYLTAVMDWHSRKVLAHRVSITLEADSCARRANRAGGRGAHRISLTLEADSCVEALREAIARYGAPEIMNTDQGSPFTGADFTDVLKAHRIAISMDGRGQWRDNGCVERRWKSLKYEAVYLKAYDSVSAARAGIGAYLDCYNVRRLHSAHGGKTPEMVYFASLPKLKAAA